jgi:hypothetical protein
MSRANREQLAYIKEVTWGTTPGTPTGQIVNMVSNSLGQSNESTISNHIRSDTNRVGVVRTGLTVGGDVAMELHYGTPVDNFFEAALRSATWGSALTVTSTSIGAATSDDSFNGTGLPAFVPGQYIKVSGFANAANNGWHRVISATSSKIIVNTNLTLESAGPSVTIKGTSIKNGTTDHSFTWQRDFQDITQFLTMRGARLGTFSLNLGTASIASATASFLGQGVTRSGSTVWSATTAAPTTDSMNTVNNIKKIFLNDTALTVDLTAFDLSITTNPEALRAIGSLSNVEISTGSIGVSGSLTEYFEDQTFLDKSIDFTSFRLAVVIEDDAGNGYVIHLPNCRITSGSPDNPGIDQQITAPYSFQATYDSTLAATIGITKYPV